MANIAILINFTHRSSNITLWPLASSNTWNTRSTRYALHGKRKRKYLMVMTINIHESRWQK